MNITFFIGNGFDLNLGLATTYSDFVKYYNTTKPDNPDNDVLKQFRKDIKDNEDKWSAAEIEMGKYTDKFDAGQGEAFNECHDGFCNHLAEYLQRQQNRIDYNYNAKQIERAIQRINSFDSSFPTQERDAITKARLRQQGEAWEFKFISFNYTDTLDKCVQLVKSKNNSIGKHKFNGSFIEHKLGVVYHVHGMTNKQMVFGVNDISQIANPKIFDCEYGDIYKAAMIKQQTNESYKENTDNNIAEIVNSSEIILIYGMSIGATDKLWWERIATWLSSDSSRHLIIYKHRMPNKEPIRTKYSIAERKAAQEIAQYAKSQDASDASISDRIHITDHNIFEDIKNIADKHATTYEILSESAKNIANIMDNNKIELITSFPT